MTTRAAFVRTVPQRRVYAAPLRAEALTKALRRAYVRPNDADVFTNLLNDIDRADARR